MKDAARPWPVDLGLALAASPSQPQIPVNRRSGAVTVQYGAGRRNRSNRHGLQYRIFRFIAWSNCRDAGAQYLRQRIVGQ